MMALHEFPAAWVVCLWVGMGLLWGSFVNVLIYRMPRGKNIAWPGSQCPTCGAPVRAYDNVPVLSYLVLRGRTRCCNTTLSARYPFVESLCGAWGLLVALGVPVQGGAAPSMGAAAARDAAVLAMGLLLIAQVFIDLDFMILMPSLNALVCALGFATVPLRGFTWVDAAVGTLALPISLFVFSWGYSKLRGLQAMGIGGGDFHLLLALGPWTGAYGSLFVLFAGAVQSVLAAVAVRLTLGKIPLPAGVREELAELRKLAEAGDAEAQKELDEDLVAHVDEGSFFGAALPLGPFLILGAFEWLMFRTEIAAWAGPLLGGEAAY